MLKPHSDRSATHSTNIWCTHHNFNSISKKLGKLKKKKT